MGGISSWDVVVDGAVVVPDGEGAPVEPHDDRNRVIVVVALGLN